MDLSLKDFLVRGRLCDIAVGGRKEEVVDSMGVPGWWEGQPSIPCEESQLWRYGPLQVVYDGEGHVTSLSIHFDGAEFPRSNTDFVPSAIDARLSGHCTVEDYVALLRENDVPIGCETDAAGKH